MINGKSKSSVAGRSNTSKYLGFIFIAIIAAILGQTLFRTNPTKNPEENKSTVQTADASAVQLNLGTNVPTQPHPILPPPKINMPSVLPPPDITSSEENSQADSQRLKAPSLVYTAKEDSARDNQNAQNSGNEGFLQQAANNKVVTVTAKRQSNMDNKILQGKLIPAVLETAVNSDLPGMVRAVVNTDVYGDTGRYVLLPKGTRLIGVYNSSLEVGQTRVMIVWTRAITPQHVDIALGSPDTDSLGQTGATGVVDNHFWQVFGTSALLSVLGVAASNSNVGGNTNSNLGVYGNPYQAAVAQGVMNSSNNVLQSRVNIQPTIHINQGSAIQVFVARDLDFSGIAAYQNSTAMAN